MNVIMGFLLFLTVYGEIGVSVLLALEVTGVKESLSKREKILCNIGVLLVAVLIWTNRVFSYFSLPMIWIEALLIVFLIRVSLKHRTLPIATVVNFFLLLVTYIDLALFFFLTGIYASEVDVVAYLLRNYSLLRNVLLVLIRCISIIIYLWVRKKQKNYSIIITRQIRLIWTIYVVGLAGFNLIYYNFVAESWNFSLHNSMFIFLIIMVAVLVFTIHTVWQNNQERLQFTQMRSAMLEEIYRNATEKRREESYIRHDFKNHLNVVREYLNNGKLDKAKNYIEEISKTAMDNTVREWSGNMIIDVILNEKSQIAKRKHVKMRIQTNDLTDLPINDKDICVILANLLDNALKASERMEKGIGWIRVLCKKKQDFFHLKIENNYVGILKKEGEQYITCKADKQYHGLGLESVAETVKNCNGELTLSHDDGKFVAQVTIFL